MATTPEARLVFRDGCPDCGERQVDLPKPLPPVDDHFDWDARDYDSIRMFAMEELAASYPERSRWTPADMEVVIVELIACLLDRYSNTLDVVQGEAKLETARRPESVRRLLAFIGYDATIETPRALYGGEIADDSETLRRKLERYWYRSPQAMAEARLLGPQKVHTQHRMVTLADYTERMEEHPLVLRARADAAWTGSWTSLRVVTVNWRNLPLDTALTDDPAVPDAQPRRSSASMRRVASYRRPGKPGPPSGPCCGPISTPTAWPASMFSSTTPSRSASTCRSRSGSRPPTTAPRSGGRSGKRSAPAPPGSLRRAACASVRTCT
jgi:hypothetical protein